MASINTVSGDSIEEGFDFRFALLVGLDLDAATDSIVAVGQSPSALLTVELRGVLVLQIRPVDDALFRVEEVASSHKIE